MKRGWKIILYEELKWLEVTKNAEKKELSWREIDYGPMGDTLIFLLWGLYLISSKFLPFHDQLFVLPKMWPRWSTRLMCGSGNSTSRSTSQYNFQMVRMSLV